MELFIETSFDAAHFLPYVEETHKCRRLHGHTYLLKVYIRGEADNHMGWIMDFAEVKKIVKQVVQKLDHFLLNDIPGLENPTAENLSRWIWNQLKNHLPGLSQIILQETPGTGVIYRGE